MPNLLQIIHSQFVRIEARYDLCAGLCFAVIVAIFMLHCNDLYSFNNRCSALIFPPYMFYLGLPNTFKYAMLSEAVREQLACSCSRHSSTIERLMETPAMFTVSRIVYRRRRRLQYCANFPSFSFP